MTKSLDITEFRKEFMMRRNMKAWEGLVFTWTKMPFRIPGDSNSIVEEAVGVATKGTGEL